MHKLIVLFLFASTASFAYQVPRLEIPPTLIGIWAQVSRTESGKLAIGRDASFAKESAVQTVDREVCRIREVGRVVSVKSPSEARQRELRAANLLAADWDIVYDLESVELIGNGLNAQACRRIVWEMTRRLQSGEAIGLWSVFITNLAEDQIMDSYTGAVYRKQ